MFYGFWSNLVVSRVSEISWIRFFNLSINNNSEKFSLNNYLIELFFSKCIGVNLNSDNYRNTKMMIRLKNNWPWNRSCLWKIKNKFLFKQKKTYCKFVVSAKVHESTTKPTQIHLQCPMTTVNSREYENFLYSRSPVIANDRISLVCPKIP